MLSPSLESTHFWKVHRHQVRGFIEMQTPVLYHAINTHYCIPKPSSCQSAAAPALAHPPPSQTLGLQTECLTHPDKMFGSRALAGGTLHLIK